MLASVVVTPAASLLAPRQEEALLNRAFARGSAAKVSERLRRGSFRSATEKRRKTTVFPAVFFWKSALQDMQNLIY